MQIPCGLLHINKCEWCYWNQVAHYWSKVVLPLFQILNSAFPHSDYLWCILAIYVLAFAASVNVKSLSDMSQFRLILAVIAFTVQILLAITVSGRVSVPVSDFSASFWLVISDVSRFSWLGRSMLTHLREEKHNVITQIIITIQLKMNYINNVIIKRIKSTRRIKVYLNLTIKYLWYSHICEILMDVFSSITLRELAIEKK